MPKAAHFATRQAAADNAVSYSVNLGWGCSGYRVRTAHIPNGPYLAMAKHDDGNWRHIDWCTPSLQGTCLNPTSVNGGTLHGQEARVQSDDLGSGSNPVPPPLYSGETEKE